MKFAAAENQIILSKPMKTEMIDFQNNTHKNLFIPPVSVNSLGPKTPVHSIKNPILSGSDSAKKLSEVASTEIPTPQTNNGEKPEAAEEEYHSLDSAAEKNGGRMLPVECEIVISQLYEHRVLNAPDFGVSHGMFRQSLCRTLEKYLPAADFAIGIDEINEFFNQLQIDDLFLALGCAAGNEQAWWQFDSEYHQYLERTARQLAKSEADVEDAVNTVYSKLYGTRFVEGKRISKFLSYSGRGSLRGWLRIIQQHAVFDFHRAHHNEVSLDEMRENIGEGCTQASFAEPSLGGEAEMLDELDRAHYRQATLSAIESAFATLENHEKLLLLYYHVEHLKMREIAQMASLASSPLRGWFRRKTANRRQNPESRIHESTIMRWLEKTYGKVLRIFCQDLTIRFNLKDEELKICVELATQDLTGCNLYKNLTSALRSSAAG